MKRPSRLYLDTFLQHSNPQSNQVSIRKELPARLLQSHQSTKALLEVQTPIAFTSYHVFVLRYPKNSEVNPNYQLVIIDFIGKSMSTQAGDRKETAADLNSVCSNLQKFKEFFHFTCQRKIGPR